MARPGHFSLQIGAFVAKAKDRADLVVRKLSLDMFRTIVLRSPVDTGRFRANWQLAPGNIPDGVLEIDDKTGQATISVADAKALGLKAGDVIYIVNNVPYAMRLEYGFRGTDSLGRTYNQAPKMMVGLTVQEFQAWLNKAVNDAKAERP